MWNIFVSLIWWDFHRSRALSRSQELLIDHRSKYFERLITYLKHWNLTLGVSQRSRWLSVSGWRIYENAKIVSLVSVRFLSKWAQHERGRANIYSAGDNFKDIAIIKFEFLLTDHMIGFCSRARFLSQKAQWVVRVLSPASQPSCQYFILNDALELLLSHLW